MAYFLILLLMMFLEESLVFFPTRFPEGNWQPERLDFEDIEFYASDGTKLHGWYVPHDQPRAHVLFCHGNAGNLSDRAYLLGTLRDGLDVAVFIFDYRGYGRSDGRPNEEGVIQDAHAACEAFAQRAGIQPSEIVLMGRSLGGAVAVELAAVHGARGLILESTFTSLPDVAAHHYPWLPVRWLMRTRLNALSRVADYHGPLLQSHGDADEIIPYQLGRRLYDAAVGPKQFITIANGHHNDPQSADYYTALDKFLGQLASSGGL